MPDFSIKIVPVGFGAGFQPDLPGRQVGDPLYAAPSSIVTWANMTNDTHQIQTDDGTYTSEEILPQVSTKLEYVLPSDYVTVSYHCTKHAGETGTISIQSVVNMDPLTPIVTFFAALALAGLSALPARAQQPTTPPSTSQIACLPDKQPLVKVPEVVSSGGRLRATMISTTEQVRMPSRYPTTIDTKPSQPGDPTTFHACFPEWVRAFRSPDTTTPWPGQTKGYLDPMNGPTLRARVGDVIELTFLNQIDPLKFGNSIDRGDQQGCDSTSVGYPTQAGDSFPNCFHGSTTANIHFHGTHTNPTSTGDNVFLEIVSSKRLTGTSMPPPPSFDDFFAQCEAQLAKGSHVEWPVKWSDLPTTYTDMQKQWLQTFDEQMKKANLPQALWPIDEQQIAEGLWPQYYIGAYPYCFKLPQYPETTQAPAASGTMGSTEMTAHQGMATPAVTQQGGPLQMGQSPGTHWYHAHKHGSTTIDLSNGFGGAFIIEGLYDDQINEVYKAFGSQWTRTQPVLVINQFGTSPNLKGGAGQDKGPDFEVNGRVNPVISMKPGEVQMWRIVNISGRAGTLFIGPPPGFNWRKLAIDGVQLHPDNYKKSLNQQFLLAAGNRVDLLVQAPAAACTTKGGCASPVQVHNVVDPSDLKPATPPARGPFDISLMTVNVSGNPVQMPFPDSSPASTFPDDLKDITKVDGTNTIEFGTVPQQFNNGAPPRSMAAIHTINGKKFSNEVGVSVLLNRVEEWTITNNTVGISHPFHIHINPFQVTQIFSPASATLSDGKTPRYVATTDPNQPIQPGQCRVNPLDDKTWVACTDDPNYSIPQPRIWWDVFPIPSALQWTSADGKTTVNIKGYFKMRSRFVDYPGWFVIHCHILAHEDRGMMTIVEVTPLLSKYSHH
jgi:FtsP/CotA-like multicopper oxidase with cupredoxin domain